MQLSFPVFVALLFFSCHPTSSTPLQTSTYTATNATDRYALLSFKSMITDDPHGVLASWNDSIHFCQWQGITCGHRHPNKVVSVDLNSLDLVGSISPALANLTLLRTIDFSNNLFHGDIPRELGSLHALKHLDISNNSLEGEIPLDLSHCVDLQILWLNSNLFHGKIPRELGSLRQLKSLDLSANSLEGEIPLDLSHCADLYLLWLNNNTLGGGIPSEFGHLSSLKTMDLSANNLTGQIPSSLANISLLAFLSLSRNQLWGNIPPAIGNILSLKFLYLDINLLSGLVPSSLGKLSALMELDLSLNNLTGGIPPSLWNLSSLQVFELQFNHLSGIIDPNIGLALPNLQFLALNGNQIHGPIPVSLSNASSLEWIQLDDNKLNGNIPPNLGTLQNLSRLTLYSNQLEAEEPNDWSFISALTNCTNLLYLQLQSNHLGGKLPHSIANLSTKLQWLDMGNNNIYGSIPPEIGEFASLTELVMGPNLLTGSIPASIGNLRMLGNLDLAFNKFSGEIPSTLGNLTQVTELYLDNNALSGSIPRSLGNCQNLELLYLNNNNLTGTIPMVILTISTLSRVLNLSSNSLTGPIPSEIGSLRNLGKIDFSGNKLSGEIPINLGKCQVLEVLKLGSNFFNGSIPSSLDTLKGLKELDLSQNNLSGIIPNFLQDFHALYNLNLSFNNFEGEMPRDGVFANGSAVSVLGNNKLCGGNTKLHLPPCPFQFQKKKHRSSTLIVIVSISSTFLCLILLFCIIIIFYRKQKSRTKASTAPSLKEELAKISYAELVKATNGFSTENIIGVGSSGSVYKGVLNDEGMKVFAVKVLNLALLGAVKSFMAECDVLRNIRHRNLVKVLTACSSVDFRGNDFKAIIFEFMANGSLDSWLHPEVVQVEQKRLNLIQRLNIAMDVASALDYLHNYGEMTIIHCDLKPSNVLLDDEMTAHVGDFGLSRFLKTTKSKSSQNSTASSGLKGTIGYVAPEYGIANRVSANGDVYSYGILLLEMFTGRRPTDGTFKEGLSLRKYVELALPERVMDIMDVQLLLKKDIEANDNMDQSMNDARTMECVASVLRIGLSCSSEHPAERMKVGAIIREFHAIRDVYLRS